MNWIPITCESQVDDIFYSSNIEPQVIFKHSTKCSISIMAKNRLERQSSEGLKNFHYLDLLEYRQVSNYIAEKFNIIHQSPQILVISKGECIYEETHSAINMDEIISQMS
jgi:bacillithiol system protein YtxJ